MTAISLPSLFAPELFALAVLGVGLLLGMFWPAPRWAAGDRPASVRQARRRRHVLPRCVRARLGPPATRLTVAELARDGLDAYPFAAGVFMPDEDHGIWCSRCLATGEARTTLAGMYGPDTLLTVLFGIDAVTLAARMCDYPGHVHGAAA